MGTNIEAQNEWQQSSLERRCILVVENDSDTLKMLRFVLEQRGADVLTSDNVPAALEQFKMQRPDVILADIGMPDLNGYALIAEIRRIEADRGGHTKAIAVTAFVTEGDRKLAADSGFDGYISKPFDPRALVLMVAQFAAGE